MSTYTGCLDHSGRMFVRYEDMYNLCGGDRAKQAAHRVLEMKTGDRMMELRTAGKPITEENLWITLSWDDFVDTSLHEAEQSTFRRMLPRIEKDGFVRSRYVKVDRNYQPITDKAGNILWWPTYQDAQHERAIDGQIMIQYLYLYEKANALLHKQHEEGPGGGDATDDTGSARGGNLGAALPVSSVASSIAHTTLSYTTGRY